MNEADTGSAQQSYWERWTGDRGPFYTACPVYLLELISNTRPVVTEEEKPDIEVTTGITRQILRNLPTVLLTVLVIYIPATAFGYAAEGRIQIPTLSLETRTIGLLIPIAVIACVWLYSIYRIISGALRGSPIGRSLVFFATALPLGAGTVHAVYTVVVTAEATGEPAITIQAGYFLFVLVAGHLVYDGLVLRAEHLFTQLRETSIVKQAVYDDFYEEMTEALGDTYGDGSVRIPKSVAFALVIALVPLLLPFVFDSFQAWGVVSYVAYNLVTLFVIAILYDVFVLIYYFVELLRRDILEYQPFHPDEHGGFRDLGRFATRVNVILFVAGGYVAYRFYAEGLVLISGGEISSSLAVLTWGLFYVGPLVGYMCLVLFWLYHSFFRLHGKMRDGRQRRIEELQHKSRKDQGDPPQEFSDLDKDAPPWESLQNAPTWPINRQSLLGILIVDALPVLASLFV